MEQTDPLSWLRRTLILMTTFDCALGLYSPSFLQIIIGRPLVSKLQQYALADQVRQVTANGFGVHFRGQVLVLAVGDPAVAQ